MDALFSEDDRERIARAVEAAEAQVSAEIVPYVVVQSDVYPAARWRGGVLGTLLVVSLAALIRGLSLSPVAGYVTDGAVLASALGVGVLSAVVAGTFPPLTRALTATDEQNRAVYRRALEAFVDEEVFATDDRTGILLFVSLVEHRIEVLADRGIDAVVDETAWADVADRVRRGIEQDRLTKGLLDGIERCGALLDEHGMETRPGDEDELSDNLRRGDR